MSYLLKKLINKRCSTRLITTLTQQKTPLNLTAQLFPIHQSILNQGFKPINEEKDEYFGAMTLLSKLEIYPSYSYGFLQDQVLLSGSGLSQLIRPKPVGSEMEDPGMMWADSVKKKRKKKMNKHKYKKLRKRLRRKTKA